MHLASGIILSDHFYNSRAINKQEERRRVVLETTKIILDDIRNKVYDIESYPPPDEFLEYVNSGITETMQLI